jgi:hypothetical protein
MVETLFFYNLGYCHIVIIMEKVFSLCKLFLMYRLFFENHRKLVVLQLTLRNIMTINLFSQQENVGVLFRR